MRQQEVKRHARAKKALALKIRHDEDATAELAQVIESAIDLKCVLMSGRTKIIEKDIIFPVVRYSLVNHDSMEEVKLVDIFLVTSQLPLFVVDPKKYIPRNANLGMVYVFGLNEDFAERVGPYVLKLEEEGFNSVHYFAYDDGEYSGGDAIDFAHYLIGMASQPDKMRIMKKALVVDGVCDITNLSQIRSLKRLVNSV